MKNPNNSITVFGYLADGLSPAHEIEGEVFYHGTLIVSRISGTLDYIPLTVPGKLLDNAGVDLNAGLWINGQLRSYFKTCDGSKKHVLTLFTNSITDFENENAKINSVTLTGVICKVPRYRVTPMGREICDLMIAVDRAFGKSDYIPCIAWGRNAQYASRFIIGNKVTIAGMLQSRKYNKTLEDGTEATYETYEVSAFEIARFLNEEVQA